MDDQLFLVIIHIFHTIWIKCFGANNYRSYLYQSETKDDMRKDEKSKFQPDITVDANLAVGAAIGTIFGNSLEFELHADNKPEEQIESFSQLSSAHSAPLSNISSQGNMSQVESDGASQDLELVEYVVPAESVVSVDQESIVGLQEEMMHLDQNNIAEILMTDTSNGDSINEEEIVEIEGTAPMDRSLLEGMDGSGLYLAENDYVNDANVDDYLA